MSFLRPAVLLLLSVFAAMPLLAQKTSSKAAATPKPGTPAPKKGAASSKTTPKTKPAAKKTGAASKPGAAGKKSPSPKPKPKPSTPPAGGTPAKSKSATTPKSGEPASKPSETKPDASPKPATPSPDAASGGAKKAAPNASIQPEELVEFAAQPEPVQQLIRTSLALTRQNLTYLYGSADPALGGMDCSGAIHYVLRKQGLKDVPRDASGQYVWARKNGVFFAVVGKKADSFEFSDLLPGDVLFWSGTYAVDRDPPVTHSMIYLGVEKRTGQRVMFGSSDGRSYDGKARWGVSVFDFKMPRPPSNANSRQTDFLGYARIPGLRGEGAEPGS